MSELGQSSEESSTNCRCPLPSSTAAGCHGDQTEAGEEALLNMESLISFCDGVSSLPAAV